jgi:hypothetical protein
MIEAAGKGQDWADFASPIDRNHPVPDASYAQSPGGVEEKWDKQIYRGDDCDLKGATRQPSVPKLIQERADQSPS